MERKSEEREARVEQLKKQGALSCILAHIPENSFLDWWVMSDCSRWWSEAWSPYLSCLGSEGGIERAVAEGQ